MLLMFLKHLEIMSEELKTNKQTKKLKVQSLEGVKSKIRRNTPRLWFLWILKVTIGILHVINNTLTWHVKQTCF